MQCKFCGCTDDRPCMIPLMGQEEEFRLAGDREMAEFMRPCEWIVPNICSAPACVEKGYAEARIQFADWLIDDFFQVSA